MIIVQFSLSLIVFLVSIDVLNESPPVCLPAVAQELDAHLVLDVGLIHGVYRLKVQLQHTPCGMTIIVLGGTLGMSSPAGPLKASLEVDKEGGIVSVDIGHFLPSSPLLKLPYLHIQMILVDDGVTGNQLMVKSRIFTVVIISILGGNQLIPQEIHQWRVGINATNACCNNVKLCGVHLPTILQLLREQK